MRDDFNSFVEWAPCPFLIFLGGLDDHPTYIHPASEQCQKFSVKEELELKD